MLLIIRGNVYKKVYNGAVMNNIMNKMLAVNVGPTLGKKMSSQPAKRHVDKTSSKILPTCWLNLLDIKKKELIFAENRAVTVCFSARKS